MGFRTGKKEENIRKDIYEAADAKLSRKSMTVYELRAFLKDKGYEKAEIDALVDRYTELGYLDDKRYCGEYFDYAFKKNRSVRRTFSDLEEKGVAPDTIRDAFDEYEDINDKAVDERAMAEREAVRVLRAGGVFPDMAVPEKMKGRVGRKLYSFGYRESLVYDIIDDLDRINREN